MTTTFFPPMDGVHRFGFVAKFALFSQGFYSASGDTCKYSWKLPVTVKSRDEHWLTENKFRLGKAIKIGLFWKCGYKVPCNFKINGTMIRWSFLMVTETVQLASYNKSKRQMRLKHFEKSSHDKYPYYPFICNWTDILSER